MIELSLVGGQPGAGPVWDRTFLGPLAPGALTPFSHSVLSEIISRAWYLYFDRLGFDPTPRSRVVRIYQGRPYVNLTLSAELDARLAGREPVSWRIDGTDRAVCSWEKPGFLAGLKTGRNANKIGATLEALQEEIGAITAQGQTWLRRVEGMRWSQAEILQIMEEIERTGAVVSAVYFAVRHNLAYWWMRLQTLVRDTADRPSASLVHQALTHVDGLVEGDMARRIVDLAAAARSEPAALAWLRAGAYGAWQTDLSASAFAGQAASFLADFGHRAIGEGELRTPRWSENPWPIFDAVRTCVETGVSAAPVAAVDGISPLLAAVDAKQRKEAQELVQQICRWLPLQSRALHAYAYVLAGTRRWALAAGNEAMGDKRLLALDDVFFYELEETKQMMTGEWNISDRSGIHATAADRKQQWETWRQAFPGVLLVGDREACLSKAGQPAAAGKGSGPLALVVESGQAKSAQKPVWAVVQPDSGCAVLLPGAAGMVAAQGMPLDPAVTAARALGVPAVTELGQDFAVLRAGQAAAVDGDAGQVRLA